MKGIRENVIKVKLLSCLEYNIRLPVKMWQSWVCSPLGCIIHRSLSDLQQALDDSSLWYSLLIISD